MSRVSPATQRDWILRSVGDLFTVDSQLIGPENSAFGQLPFLGLENIESNSRQFVNGENKDTGKTTCFRFGPQHVLYGKLRPYLNKVFLPTHEGRCSLEILPLLPKNGFNRDFVAGVLQSPEVVSFATKHSTGGRMPRVDLKKLVTLEIPLPSDVEKCNELARTLSKKLRCCQDIRLASENQVEAAESMRIRVIGNAFAKISNGETPRIEDISSLVTDGPHVTPNYLSQGIPFVTVENICGRRLDFNRVRFISAEDHATFSKRGKAEKDDILISKDGTLGVPCLVDTDEAFSFFVSVALIKPNKDLILPHYLFFALDSPIVRKRIAERAAGAGLKHLVIHEIKDLRIPFIRDKQRQQIFVDRLREQMMEIERVLSSAHETSKAIQLLRSATLRKAFSNKPDVSYESS